MAKLMNLQYAGDFKDAHRRMTQGLAETYYGHQYILRGMGELGRSLGEVAMVCALTDTAYDELVEPGLRVVGAGMSALDSAAAIEIIRKYAPSHLVLHTPDRRIAAWAAANGIRTMLMLADSFNGNRLKDRIRYYLLARTLNKQGIEWVANHGLKSCLSLDAIGVDAAKIIPWDYIYRTTPGDHAMRELEQRPDTINLAYVGHISVSKGCGDAVKAVQLLKARNIKAHLRLAGSGDIEQVAALARQLGVEADVTFAGRIPHEAVFDFFRSAHIALVTSRHDYPEGFPLTIYEALTSRTPLVVSDHPMFTGNLTHRESALVFKAGDADSLAGKISELVSEPMLYASLSERSLTTWQELQLPAKWVDVIANWVKDGEKDRTWLRGHSLQAETYKGRLSRLRLTMA